MSDLTRPEQGELQIYDPEKGLKSIAVAESAEKHFRRAKDARKLFEAIEKKINGQAEYVVWRDGVVVHGGKQDRGTAILPEADPGHDVARRWRKRLCTKGETGTVVDREKLALALEDAQHRCHRICEQEKIGTVRGTEGTGEFERYTPAKYIEAARLVLGGIDLEDAAGKMVWYCADHQLGLFYDAKRDSAA
jgi:hypothetical protein